MSLLFARDQLPSHSQLRAHASFFALHRRRNCGLACPNQHRDQSVSMYVSSAPGPVSQHVRVAFESLESNRVLSVVVGRPQVHAAIDGGGKVLIPVSAFGPAQELQVVALDLEKKCRVSTLRSGRN
eukprot:6207761-Pleurochrysis_carterae.AAC.2